MGKLTPEEWCRRNSVRSATIRLHHVANLNAVLLEEFIPAALFCLHMIGMMPPCFEGFHGFKLDDRHAFASGQ